MATMLYKYGMRLRGFSIGCQPLCGIVRVKNSNCNPYFSILWYSRELDQDEIEQYELDYLGEDKID